MKHKILFIGFLLLGLQGKAQSSSQIYKQLEAFNFLGNVLYLAAHPDDENTRLISYFANHKKARTAYLSITRGDGGQNLIGTELEELLGVLRTQELLAARAIDGGQQFFSTAKDFGYSKHPDEAFSVWDKQALLAQVVERIRNFRPDIIINRFDHRTPGSTHGHHTGSAILSYEAFHLANDPNAFPEQLKQTSTWQPKRLFYNTSWWAYGSRTAFDKADKTNMLTLNNGVFDPLTGEANPVTAAKSRSQHKSQGFGSSPQLGDATEYIERIAGAPLRGNDPFEGIDTSWTRVKGGAVIQKLMEQIMTSFDFKHPYKSVPDLLLVYERLAQLEDPFWKKIKTEALTQIIKNCLGLQVQLNAGQPKGTPGEVVQLNLLVNHPSPLPLQLEEIQIGSKILSGQKLVQNTPYRTTLNLSLPDQLTPPYWLLNQGTPGNYSVANQALIGRPESPNPVEAQFSFQLMGKTFTLSEPLLYRTTDPVEGEVVTPFHSIPKLTLQWEQPVLLFPKEESQKVGLLVQAHASDMKGEVSIESPQAWNITPSTQPFNIAQKGTSQELFFEITPPKENGEASFKAVINLAHKKYEYALQELDYAHIPKQYILQPNRLKAARIDLQTPVEQVGYLAGAGDKIPESLEAIGIRVTQLQVEDLQLETLAKYPTIILGIRAFNVLEALSTQNKILWDYAAQGGTLVFQYNTSRNLKTEALTPYSLSLSRDRVTDEKATVTFLNPNHPLLNWPNKITAHDFEGWVQERGLYFPQNWDPKFEALLGMNDPNETQKKGSLLVARYGKGHIIYTGLSFFRQLPKGVSGAYSLFINLISYGHEKK